MKILHLCYSDTRGGAAKACFRSHLALLNAGVNSNILTCLPTKNNDRNVTCYSNTLLKQIWRKLLKVSSLAIVKVFQKTSNADLHTFEIFSVINAEKLNKSDADIIHLHWVNYCMLGIKEIKKIKKPIVWTFHDMWAFMGCEHYDDLNSPFRYENEYLPENKNVKGLDLNRFIWKMKNKHFKNTHFQILTPSKWLKDCVNQSALLKEKPVELIPYTISESAFYTQDKILMRKKLGYPLDKRLILFGAFNAISFNKGGDLLYKALEKINRDDVEFIIFGASTGKDITGIKTHFAGYIREEAKLNEIYNACDVMVVPSRQDNLPNTVLEAIACGIPVLGFNIGGLPDMVVHKKNGYLAKPFEIDDLIFGLNYILDNPNKEDFAMNCRRHFDSNYSEKIIVNKLLDLYNRVLDNGKLM